VPDKPSDLVQGTLDIADSEDTRFGGYAWIPDFRPNRTDEPGRFSPQCWFVISRD
jgi:hypothetical protein